MVIYHFTVYSYTIHFLFFFPNCSIPFVVIYVYVHLCYSFGFLLPNFILNLRGVARESAKFLQESENKGIDYCLMTTLLCLTLHRIDLLFNDYSYDLHSLLKCLADSSYTPFMSVSIWIMKVLTEFSYLSSTFYERELDTWVLLWRTSMGDGLVSHVRR